MNTKEEKIILEVALLCTQEPLSLQDIANMFMDGKNMNRMAVSDRCRSLLEELKQDWAGKGLELVQVANGWRFQSRAEMKPYL